MLTRPCPLNQGDRVALTAPSSPLPEAAVKEAAESLRFLGLVPVIMESCTLSRGYLAGPDQTRARDLNLAFADPSIKGIFCLRGGFGATRILPLLDFSMIQKNPKVFVGYSDITALHLAFNQLCGFVTFHGPMPGGSYRSLDAFSLMSLRSNLFSRPFPEAAVNPPGEDLEVICPGRASGTITGGNLSLLTGTLGSPYEVDAKKKILFIEEVGEQPYRLDRALTSLALAGKFRDCAGIILGTFAQCRESAAENIEFLTLSDLFKELLLPWGKPILLNFRAGHVYPQITIPMGAQAGFDTSRQEIFFHL